MKTVVFFLFCIGCGTEPDPSNRAGVCFVDPGFAQGRVWRPCDTETDGKCTVRILDRTETVSDSDPRVMTCVDCYEPYGVKGDCK